MPLAELSATTAAAAAKGGPVNISSTSDDGTMTGVMDLSKGAIRMSGTASGEQIEIILVDNTMYLGGAIAASLGQDKKWIRISSEGTDAMSQILAPLAGTLTSGLDASKAFEGITGDATATAVEGDLTTYLIELTAEQSLQMTKNLLGDDASGEITAADVGTSRTYQTVDGNGLLRKVVTERTLDGQTTTMTQTYSDWGRAEPVTAPPASEVGTLELPTVPVPTG